MKKNLKQAMMYIIVCYISSLTAKAQCVLNLETYLTDLQRIRIASRAFDTTAVREVTSTSSKSDTGFVSKSQTLTYGVFRDKYVTVNIPFVSNPVRIINTGLELITINNLDSLVVIQPAEEFYERTTMLDKVLQPGFEDENLSDVCARDTAAGKRIMNFYFKDRSYLKSFSILYDTTSLNVYEVKMAVKDFANPSSYSYSVSKTFSYPLEPVIYFYNHNVLFNPSTYYVITNGQVQFLAPYSGYKFYGSPIDSGGGGIDF
jgi:hypothetical protein